MSSPDSESASALLSQTNDLLTTLARLNSNVELYTQVHSLQKNVNALEEKYKSLQNNINTSTCNAQCKDLNATGETGSVDEFLANLLSLKFASNPPTVPENAGFSQPFVVENPQASAPP
jgi:hypothetical protein